MIQAHQGFRNNVLNHDTSTDNIYNIIIVAGF